MTARIRYPVFHDKDGNRFIFPGFFESDSDEFQPTMKGEQSTLCYFLGITKEKEPLDVASDEIVSFVRAEAGSSYLEHGYCTVYMISGPVFDDAMKNS